MAHVWVESFKCEHDIYLIILSFLNRLLVNLSSTRDIQKSIWCIFLQIIKK